MSRWSSTRKCCGMNFPATTKMIPFFVRSGVINLGPADSAFSPTSPTAPTSGNSTLKSSTRKGLWPACGQKYASQDNYIGLFETDSGFCAAVAIKTWIQLAKEAGCAQLFNCPVRAIRHDDDGVTIETADGEYQAKKAIVCAGNMGKRPTPRLPVQPVRKCYLVSGRWPL